MIEKMLVGRYLRIINNPPVKKPPGDYYPTTFELLMPTFMAIMESTGIFKKKSETVEGLHHKAHRNFIFLPWLPAKISFVATHNMDVLTGPMSGCDIVVFKDSTQSYVGHLGTDVGRDAANQEVKDAWNRFANNNPADLIAGFNPVRDWPGAFPKPEKGDFTQPKIFALVTGTAPHKLYSLCVYPQAKDMTMVRIAAVKEIQSASTTKLKAL